MKYGVKVIYTYSVGEDCRKFYEGQILSVNAESFDEAMKKQNNILLNMIQNIQTPKVNWLRQKKLNF